jgi:D-3-phosphoglycerate dehydrogenase / 2-oxoglutarate reductase
MNNISNHGSRVPGQLVDLTVNLNLPSISGQPASARSTQTGTFGSALLNAGASDQNLPIQVLLAEPMGDAAMAPINELSPRTAQVCSVPKANPSALQDAVLAAMKNRSTDLLVVRGNCKVNQALIEPLSEQQRPSFVLRAGTGMDNLDMDYLDSVGIEYANTPDVNTQSTAELALCLMLGVKRKIAQADAQVKSGQWNRAALAGSELGSKTLGIVGVGRIGGVVGTAAKALGMEVIGLASTRPAATNEPLPEYLSERVSLEALCKRSDVLTLHVPLNSQTRSMIGQEQIAHLSGRNAVIINTARGGVVDEAALLQALNEERIGGAGIDVFVEDPAPPGSVSDQLARHPRVVATPHIGGQTTEASAKMGQAVAEKALTMHLARAERQGALDS